MTRTILVLNTYAVDDAFGGGKYVLNNLFRRISQQFEIKFLSLVESDKIFKKVSVTANFENIHIPQNNKQSKIQWDLEKKISTDIFDVIQINHWQKNPEYVANVKKYLSNADVVILEHPYFVNLIESLHPEIPIIYHAHNVEYIQKESILRPDLLNDVKNAEKKACDLSQEIWVSSDLEKDHFREIHQVPEEKIRKLRHGIDLSSTPFIERKTHHEIKSKFKEINDKIVFVFTGSWHPPNLESVEFIISDLSPINKNFEFFIIGSVTDYYHNEHPKTKIPPNVTMLGQVSDSEKLGIYKLSDYAINPMFSGAGTNIKMLEYMAAGLPIISTSFGARGLKISNNTLLCDKENFGKTLEEALKDNYEQSHSIIENYNIVKNEYDYDFVSKKCVVYLMNLFYTKYPTLKLFENLLLDLHKMQINPDDALVDTLANELEALTNINEKNIYSSR